MSISRTKNSGAMARYTTHVRPHRALRVPPRPLLRANSATVKDFLRSLTEGRARGRTASSVPSRIVRGLRWVTQALLFIRWPPTFVFQEWTHGGMRSTSSLHAQYQLPTCAVPAPYELLACSTSSLHASATHTGNPSPPFPPSRTFTPSASHDSPDRPRRQPRATR